MMRPFLLLFAGVVGGSLLSTPADASSITLAFPATGSIVGGPDGSGTLGPGGGALRYRIGDFVEETFTGTSLADVTAAEFDLTMSNATASGVANSFEILINNTPVGAYGFVSSSFNVGQAIPLSMFVTFPGIGGIGRGDDYVLTILATSTVFPGGGSWNWVAGGSAILTGDPVAAPEPGSALLLGTGLLVVVGMRRRGSRS